MIIHQKQLILLAELTLVGDTKVYLFESMKYETGEERSICEVPLAMMDLCQVN